jgi:hypothetical protein
VTVPAVDKLLGLPERSQKGTSSVVSETPGKRTFDSTSSLF